MSEPSRGRGDPAHFQGEVIDFAAVSARVARGEFQGLYITSGALDPWIDEAGAQLLRSGIAFLVVQDTHPTPLAELADVVLAGATFAEKAGCYVNADGLLQHAEAALPPRDGSLPDLDLLAILAGRPGIGPVRSHEVLAELAETVPAFAAAKGGKIPPFGIPLSQPVEISPAELQQPYIDYWLDIAQARAGRAIESPPSRCLR